MPRFAGNVGSFFEKTLTKIELCKVGYWSTVIIVFLSLLIIGRERIEFAHLWAEDGSIFLNQHFQAGWSVVFAPYHGSYHSLPRLVVFLVETFLPLVCLAKAFVLICFGLSALLFAQFSRSRFRQYVKSDLVRMLICLSFAFLPGANQVIGNLTNLHWILNLAVFFVAVTPSRSRLSPADLLIVFVAASSAVESIIFVPLLLLRNISGLRRKTGFEWIPISSLAVLVFFALVNFAARTSNPVDMQLSLPIGRSIEALFVAGGRSVVLDTLLGERGVMFFGSLGWFPALSVASIGIFLGILFVLYRSSSHRLFLIGVGLWFMTLVMMFVARPWSLDMFGAKGIPIGWFEHRYSWVLPFGPMLWAISVEVLASKRRVALQVLLMMWITLHVNDVKELDALGTTLSWERTAARIEKSRNTGCPSKVRIRHYPRPWGFAYHSKVENDDCK
jgi:hypothetical protein